MVQPRATSARARHEQGIGCAAVRRGGWCGTGRCPGGAIVSRADGHRVGRGYRTRHRANWRGPHEPDKHAPPWGPTASPRRPHAKGIRCREYAGTTHDLPWLLDEHTRRWGAYCPPSGGGCTRGVSAERFETPLVGRAACFWRRGGNPPAPAFPRRGKRERGRSNLLAAAGICLRITPEYRPLTPSPQALTATQKPEFPPQKWLRILSQVFFRFLNGRQLSQPQFIPPPG